MGGGTQVKLLTIEELEYEIDHWSETSMRYKLAYTALVALRALEDVVTREGFRQYHIRKAQAEMEANNGE